ncbi:MAG: hypothetical protein IH973_14575, partial [Myxococcales bacterium]|nr:hypothetical protein [Myxococcales bacterium]
MPAQKKDRPWVIRTYSGHSSAAKSNELYRTNLAKGQTGLSVAFDLPTQTGYDSDHPLARGEVGKVGVPICHIDDMSTLFSELPLDQMNTSMTINATSNWLLALLIAVAERQGVAPSSLKGTTQNDIIKEYLSRGTYIFPPEASVRMTADMIAYTVEAIPGWNPVNVCSYHLQEAGATPVPLMQEAFSETQLSISPAGGFIAYESSELGYPEIFVRSFPDLGGRRMLSTLDIGPMSGIRNSDPREARSPVWSRDGSEIFYRSGNAVLRVPVGSEDTFTPGAPEVVFEGAWVNPARGRQYDVSSDGQRFLMIRWDVGDDDAPTPNELVVVQNWFEELR